MTMEDIEEVRKLRDRVAGLEEFADKMKNLEPYAVKISAHLEKARAKHACFADRLFAHPSRNELLRVLEFQRGRIDHYVRLGNLPAQDLLTCELLEAAAEDDPERVAGELYDAVAVLLRMVDVVEGRQNLGKAVAK